MDAMPKVEVKTVSDPFIDLRLFRAAIVSPEVEVKTVSDPFMDLRLFRAAKCSSKAEYTRTGGSHHAGEGQCRL